MGGRVEIESSPGSGTRITLVGPPPSVSLPIFQPIPPQDQTGESSATGASTDVIRVVLADDHHIIRQGLASLLRAEPDIEVVGEASNGMEAVKLARSLQPDIVVMDVSMPVLGGVDATVEIGRDMPSIRVIGLSMHEEGEISSAIQMAGAVAYVTKGGPPKSLVEAIRKAMNRKPDALAKQNSRS